MGKHSKGIYTVEENDYEMSIHFTYYYEESDYFSPEESELDIEYVYLNGIDITDFYFNYIDDTINNDIMQFAHENR